jgi:hypothetical protein
MAFRDFVTMEDLLDLHPVPPYLTPAQVGKVFQKHPSTVRRGCEAGVYRKAFKHGADWCIPSRYLEQQIREAEANGEFAN